MTTSTVQPKWALIGVRVCAVYLALWAIACIALVLIGNSNNAFDWLKLLLISFAVLFGLLAFSLWRLKSWSREVVVQMYIGTAVISIPLVMGHTDWHSPVSILISFAPAAIGVAGLVFLNRPTVKALFENPRSKIHNQKSPNA